MQNSITLKEQLQIAKELKAIYENINEEIEPINKRAAYLALLYNIPLGYESIFIGENQ